MSLTHIHDSTSDDTEHKQVELTLRHPGCWTLKATDRHPGTHVIEKSLYPAEDIVKGDFILASDGDVSIETFIETINGCEVVNYVTVLKQREGRARVVVTYQRDSSIVPEIVNSEFMPIEPVYITDGWEHWTVLLRTSLLSDVVSEMEATYDVNVSAIREVDPSDTLEFADIVEHVHDGLSDRQQECLIEAKEAGYYNWPRDISVKEIASEVEVSDSTLLEHIRTGEQKIIQPVLDEVQRRHPRY